MSLKLINRSPDLKRLRDEGFDIEIRSGHLLVKNVPYVNAKKEVGRGTLVSTLILNNDATVRRDTHVAHFKGEHPCDQNGGIIQQIRHQSGHSQLAPGVEVDHAFSSKPASGYADYYEKMSTYAHILSGPAAYLDPSATPKTFPKIDSTEEESVFKYVDTASSRSGTLMESTKLALGKVAIVGLGGTGAYILDLIAKTPIQEIHLFDGDWFLQHNAFRFPGAVSGEELAEKLSKTAYLTRQYSKMRRGIFEHTYVDASNVDQLRDMNFVFVCIDKSEPKKLIVEKLEEFGIPFIDVGMGVFQTEGALGAVLRVTTSTPQNRQQARTRISFSDEGDDEYNHNKQIADLNALNAVLAVIRWKKLFGFYHDFEREQNSTYSLDVNMLTSDDKA